ncbi:MAG: response regulator transcription factor [Burkholderiales bacterium]|nr:response regulator transcription factor [Burkholderiales bacterium]
MSASIPRLLIVDDEAPARNRLKDLLDDCRAELPLEITGEASNGREAIELINQSAVDIVLLDIRMPLMDGIEAARHLQKLANPPAIVFTTALDGHALEAFELNAVDYLLKPIRQDRLLAALRKALFHRALSPAALTVISSRARSHLSVTERDRVMLVPVADISYMRAELKYVTLKTLEREYLLEESLINLEKEFADRFVRVHRSCLVARKAVVGFEKVAHEGGEPHWVVMLKGLPERLPVSRRQAHVIKEF